jgi:hypothetical protein
LKPDLRLPISDIAVFLFEVVEPIAPTNSFVKIIANLNQIDTLTLAPFSAAHAAV